MAPRQFYWITAAITEAEDTRVEQCQHGEEEPEQAAFHEFIQETEETLEGVWRGASVPRCVSSTTDSSLCGCCSSAAVLANRLMYSTRLWHSVAA